MMNKLEQLKEEALLKRKALNKLTDKIARIESGQGLPELEKKYLNKCFKTKNNYSRGKPWWRYTIVDSIEFPNSFTGRQFETTSDGIRYFEVKYKGYLNHLGKQINKTEYKYYLEMLKTFIDVNF